MHQKILFLYSEKRAYFEYSMIGITSVSLLLIATSVRADLAVYCVNAELDLKGWGDIAFYEFAAEDYDC